MGDSQRTVSVILEAAERVIVQSGVEKATIEAVAREAGVSKGGVLHHFPSKDAIVIGLVARLIEKFDAEVTALRAADPEVKGSFTRAFLSAGTKKDDHCIEVFFALQAAFRNCPSLQDLLRNAHLRWQTRIEQDGIDPVCASVVRLATDGLWLAKPPRAPVPSGQFRRRPLDYFMARAPTTILRN